MPQPPVPTRNPHKPNEPLLLTTPIGLHSLGAEFDVSAPFSACRLCGALYQTPGDRDCKRYLTMGVLYEIPLNDGKSTFGGPLYATELLDACTQRRNRWRSIHERRYHTTAEIEAFAKTGFALTPEAAHRLAPFGITPLGKLHGDIDHALLTAPRVPTNDAES